MHSDALALNVKARWPEKFANVNDDKMSDSPFPTALRSHAFNTIMNKWILFFFFLGASDANFWQSADCQKLGSLETHSSNGNGRCDLFLKLRFASRNFVFLENSGTNKNVFTYCPTSQKLRLRSWRFASETLPHDTFLFFTCSLLSSAFELHPALPPQKMDMSESGNAIALHQKSRKASCRKVKSSGTSAWNPPPLGLDDLTLRHEALRDFWCNAIPVWRAGYDIVPNGRVRGARSGHALA